MARVHVIVDEAASLGSNMKCIEDALDKYRAYGIRLQMYYQSLAQLKKLFPNDQDQTALSNLTQVYFALNDNPSAEQVSNRLGEETMMVESGGWNRSYSSPSGLGAQGHPTESTSTSRNWSLMGRKLMKPEEILTMNPRLAVTFVAGQRPILTWLDRYYEQDSRKGRLSRSDALVFSLLICLILTNCFRVTVNHFKEVHYGRSVQRVEKLHSGNDRGIETSQHPSLDGAGKRHF